MAETRKVLSQTALPATTLTDCYIVPASTQVVGSTVFVCNASGSNRTFRVSVAVGGLADTPKQYLYYDVLLSRNATFTFTTGITLGPADVVRGYASGAGVSINIFGVEIT